LQTTARLGAKRYVDESKTQSSVVPPLANLMIKDVKRVLSRHGVKTADSRPLAAPADRARHEYFIFHKQNRKRSPPTHFDFLSQFSLCVAFAQKRRLRELLSPRRTTNTRSDCGVVRMLV